MRSFIIFLVLATCISAKGAIEKISVNIYFETAQSELDFDEVEKLHQIIANIHPEDDYEIVVKGHADYRGTSGYNQQLSIDRAKAVSDYLVGQGVDAKSLASHYFGEQNSSPSNPLHEDRRVEVTLVKYKFMNVRELEAALNPAVKQNFEINPGKEVMIEGEEGVKILIPEGAFTRSDGSPVTENVEVSLVEALAIQDYLAYGLATRSGKELLETGGMLKLEAKTLSGEEVIIDGSNPIVVSVPATNRMDGMELFTSSSDGADWIPVGQKLESKASLELPPRPVFRYKDLPYPEFIPDEKDKPNQPIKPSKPRMPNFPEEGRFKSKIKWYQQLNKREIQELQNIRYEKALARYHKQMNRYNRRTGGYNKKYASYLEDKNNYEMKLAEWKEGIERQKQDYKLTNAYQEVAIKNQMRRAIAREDYEKELEEWRDIRNQRIGELGERMDAMGATTESALNNYVFAFNDLGWINIDRFYKLPEDETQMIVLNDPDTTTEKVLLVFKNLNSIITFKQVDQQYKYERIPKKESAAILAYKVQDGRAMVYFKEKNEGEEEYDINYKPTKFSELRELMSRYGMTSASTKL